MDRRHGFAWKALSGAAGVLALAAMCRVARAEPAFFPTPQKALWNGASAVGAGFRVTADAGTPAATVREYRRFLAKRGFKAEAPGLTVALESAPVAECEKVAIPPAQKKLFLDLTSLQTYFLSAKGDRVEVKACGPDGFFHALMTIDKLIEKTATGFILTNVEITDYPAFPARGIFEGAYGIWDMEGRLKVLDWMASVKMNSYMYGPKADSKVSRRWREMYTDIEMFGFKRMAERARRNHIQLGYIIRPTLGIEYGSKEDLKTLTRKVRQVQSVGFRTIIMQFDDSLGMLYSPNDRKRFANLGEAEAFLSNGLYKELKAYDKEAAFVVVGEIYGGVWPMEYTKSLVKNLSPDIYIGWTGNEIGTPKLDNGDVEKFMAFYKRRPSFGDNWGGLYPLIGRSPDLYKTFTQFMMNPYNLFGELPIPGMMAKPESDLAQIEGASLAELSWKGEGYDPDAVLDRMARIYYGPMDQDLFKWVMYKDYYDYTGYYVIDSDYKTPVEKSWEAQLAKGVDGAKELAVSMERPLELLIASPQRIATGCSRPDTGKALALRAESSKAWFERVAAALRGIAESADRGDKPAMEAAVKNYLKELRKL